MMNNRNCSNARLSFIACACGPFLFLLLCWFTGPGVALTMDIVDHGERKVPKAGKRKMFWRRVDFNTGTITYGLHIRMLKQKESRKVVAIGMTSDRRFWRPCKRGWSNSSFVRINIADKDLFSYPCKVVLTDKELRLVFLTPKGNAVLFFTSTEQVDHVYVGLRLPTPRPLIPGFPDLDGNGAFCLTAKYGTGQEIRTANIILNPATIYHPTKIYPGR